MQMFHNFTLADLNLTFPDDMLDSGDDHPGHSLSPTFAKVAAFLFILIIVTSVCCNILLIIIIMRVKSLHTVMHVFIVNLAISDLITSAGTMPFDVDFMLRGIFDHSVYACGVMHFTFLISLPSSVLNLVLLTTERLISVLFPFKRTHYLKKRNVGIMLVSTWIYTFSIALYPMIQRKEPVVVAGGNCYLIYPITFDIFQLVANFSIPILYICFANLVLFYISNKHASKIRTLSVPPKSLSMHDVSDDDSDISSRERKRLSQSRIQANKHFNLKVNIRAAKKLALLVGVFLFCWLTYIILVALNISCGTCHPRELTWVGNIINYSSSAINPVLYGLLNQQIRREIKKPIRQFMTKFVMYKDFNRNHKFSKKSRASRASFISETTMVEHEENHM